MVDTAVAVDALPPDARFAISRLLGREEAEYRASVGPDGAVHFTNPAQQLSARFDDTALVLQAGEKTNLRWAFAGLGYGTTLHVPERVAPRAVENRVEYRRRGMTEWYVNGPFGVQQGFTLHAPPEGRASGLLRLVLRITEARDGASIATGVERDGRGIRLTAAGAMLKYSDLLAWDANGRALPAAIELGGDHVVLRVNDKDATYPLVIDPFIEQGQLTASDGVGGDLFGFTLGISGDTIVGGRPSGLAYVFVKPATGWATLMETARLTASDGGPLGSDVGISGDTVVVCMPGNLPPLTNSAALLYVKPSGGWTSMTETARLTASGGNFSDGFGRVVDISGDTVVVGALFAQIASVVRGAVYVYVKPAGGWTNATETAKLTASDGVFGDDLGNSVAIDGDTVVAGALLDDTGSNTSQGSAYVYTKPSGGWITMTETAKLTASDGAANNQFGWDTAISGDTVVVGVFRANVGSSVQQGAAYLFVKPGGGWVSTTETAKLTASDGSAFDFLGRSVGIDGDVVVVGAPGDDFGVSFSQGSAYVFNKPSNGWTSTTETAKIVASDGVSGDLFGASIDVRGSTVIVGSQFGLGDQKSVYVFEGEIEISIDIKPGSDPNSINCGNQNVVIPVAVLTTEDFDTTSLDHTTVRFEGAGETHIDNKSGVPRRHVEDVDGDGDPDLVFHFRLGDTALTCQSREGVLTGRTVGGQSVRGVDEVRIVSGGGDH
jgi:hypothetical protein